MDRVLVSLFYRTVWYFCIFINNFVGGTALASITIGQPIRFLTSDKLVVAMLMAWYFYTNFAYIG